MTLLQAWRRRKGWYGTAQPGPARLRLCEYFDKVVASDASARQIENARAGPNVRFAMFPEEKADLKDASVDLVTVAQPLHWFRFDDFYREVRRISKKNGVIATWAYDHHSIGPHLDRVSQSFYKDTIGKYWPAEVKYVENRYRTFRFLLIR